jgi:predicted RNA binding protein YcfA (HicA-like mRNA interferase family)
METNRAKIVRRLEREGRKLLRSGAAHDIHDHKEMTDPIVVPHHRELSAGVARLVHKQAGWSLK